MKKILDFAKEREARLAKPRTQDKAKLMVVTRDATGSIVTCQDAPIYTVEAAKSRYSIRNMRTKQVQSKMCIRDSTYSTQNLSVPLLRGISLSATPNSCTFNLRLELK